MTDYTNMSLEDVQTQHRIAVTKCTRIHKTMVLEGRKPELIAEFTAASWARDATRQEITRRTAASVQVSKVNWLTTKPSKRPRMK